ncbi:MAG: Gx transporter family protein [Limnochordia bacterium]|jgi:heptaprenyl diphosphate synthase|nr:Gx transporter family protein [Bacillota bacterium]HOB07947.1 Gx transporter family protein [Limnochordia bacterium]NLH31553.1 Gx transporter family protein [Bacillota bacterium]HPT92113.1 Gx transporter family protein [Limnochordia bacterium]HPZ29900.1 Gx transporter family protein [Limnochordia bacterium]
MSTNRTSKLVYLGLMVGIALALHIIESLLPIPAPIPGAKLGLANIAALYVIIRMGTKESVCVTVLRTILGALYGAGLFAPTFLLSFFGGLVSTVVMGLGFSVFQKQFSIIGLSVLGAVTHNVAQLAVASFMFEQIGFFYYLPYLLFYALPTGFFVGIVTQQLAKKIHF